MLGTFEIIRFLSDSSDTTTKEDKLLIWLSENKLIIDNFGEIPSAFSTEWKLAN